LHSGAYRTNVLYSKLSKNDKIARIDRVLCTIFAGKQKELISTNIAIPALLSAPVVIKAEPLSTVQVKQ
jgi:hypothetical protein